MGLSTGLKNEASGISWGSVYFACCVFLHFSFLYFACCVFLYFVEWGQWNQLGLSVRPSNPGSDLYCACFNFTKNICWCIFVFYNFVFCGKSPRTENIAKIERLPLILILTWINVLTPFRYLPCCLPWCTSGPNKVKRLREKLLTFWAKRTGQTLSLKVPFRFFDKHA